MSHSGVPRPLRGDRRGGGALRLSLLRTGCASWGASLRERALAAPFEACQLRSPFLMGRRRLGELGRARSSHESNPGGAQGNARLRGSAGPAVLGMAGGGHRVMPGLRRRVSRAQVEPSGP